MKKGFTLIELLAVIIIIALVVGIVYQTFNKQITLAKAKAYDRQIETIISLAKDYHLEHPDTTFVTINTLTTLGLIDESKLKDPRDKSEIAGCIIFTNNEYNQITYSYTSNILDCDV